MAEPPKSPPLRQRYDSRQREVIDACARAFAERGYHGTSIDDLVAATGLARGGLYHYIGSKQAALSRILADLMGPLLERATPIAEGRTDENADPAATSGTGNGTTGTDHGEAFRDGTGNGATDHDGGSGLPLSAEQRLRAITRIWMEHVEGHRDYVMVFQQERHTIEREPIWHDVRRDRDAFERLLTGILREGVAGGEFVVEDPGLSALALLGMVNHSATWFRPGGRLSAEQVADGFCDLLLSGIRPR